MRYAQINLAGICIAISALAFDENDEIPPNLIALAEPDFSPIGWTYSNGSWINAPQPGDTNANILNAPATGFGGPSGQEIFNGNR